MIQSEDRSPIRSAARRRWSTVQVSHCVYNIDDNGPVGIWRTAIPSLLFGAASARLAVCLNKAQSGLRIRSGFQVYEAQVLRQGRCWRQLTGWSAQIHSTRPSSVNRLELLSRMAGGICRISPQLAKCESQYRSSHPRGLRCNRCGRLSEMP